MIADKFPPQFDFQKRGVVIDEALCRHLPSYTELSALIAYIVEIREKYRPIMNYDLSGRSSRGLFLGIPECGIEALGSLQNRNLCEVAIATFSSTRRSEVSRNCYIWGCESKVLLTSLGLMEALSRWYVAHSVRSPIFIDVSQSIPSLEVEVNHEESITVQSVDLKCILEKALDIGAPFICLRVHPSDEQLIRSYNLPLQEFLVNTTIDSTVNIVLLYLTFRLPTFPSFPQFER